ncbi:MAG: BON domain-containing protein, partial [Pirellulales bacterium]
MSRILAAAMISTVLLATIGSPAARAEPPQNADESFGQKLDRGLDKLGKELRQGWAEVRVAIDKMGVEARVYGRLHWDKDLNSATIDILVRDSNTVVLKGSVPTAEARDKALQLTQDTTG